MLNNKKLSLEEAFKGFDTKLKLLKLSQDENLNQDIRDLATDALILDLTLEQQEDILNYLTNR